MHKTTAHTCRQEQPLGYKKNTKFIYIYRLAAEERMYIHIYIYRRMETHLSSLIVHTLISKPLPIYFPQ